MHKTGFIKQRLHLVLMIKTYDLGVASLMLYLRSSTWDVYVLFLFCVIVSVRRRDFCKHLLEGEREFGVRMAEYRDKTEGQQ